MRQLAPRESNEESVSDLMSGLVADVKQLVQQEARLIRLEAKATWNEQVELFKIKTFKSVAMCIGGTLMTAALVIFLNEVAGLSWWISLAIVGGLYLTIGLIPIRKEKEG